MYSLSSSGIGAVVTVSSGMVGSGPAAGVVVAAGLLAPADRSGLFIGGEGNERSLNVMTSAGADLGSFCCCCSCCCCAAGFSAVAGVVFLFLGKEKSSRFTSRPKSNPRGVGTSSMGDGTVSLTPAAPMRVGRSCMWKGSMGVSLLPSVLSVSLDFLGCSCESRLSRSSWIWPGVRSSSASMWLKSPKSSDTFSDSVHRTPPRLFCALGPMRGSDSLLVDFTDGFRCALATGDLRESGDDFSGDLSGDLIDVRMGGGGLSGDLKGGVRMGDWAAAEPADGRRGERSWLSSGLPAGEGEGEGEGEGLG